MKRYLQFRNYRTNDAGKPLDVTGKSDTEVERLMRGMLRNIDSERGWFVDDTTDPIAATR